MFSANTYVRCAKRRWLLAAQCANCDWTGKLKELDAVSDIEQRLCPGEEVPAGQCPECGALAYIVRDDAKSNKHDRS